MAEALSLPVVDYVADDSVLMKCAADFKLKFAVYIAEIAKFREKIGLTATRIEESIVEDNYKATENRFINFEEFVQLLKIPADDFSYTLFSFFVEHGRSEDVIDLKEYLLHALFLIKRRDENIELVKLLFMLYGDKGMIKREAFKSIINLFPKLRKLPVDRLFFSIDSTNCGFINFEEFQAATENDKQFKSLYVC